jgi:tetratricopeptide (TPR) repeat protein
LKINQPAPAAEYLQKAIEKNPEDGGLYFQLSRALRALGRTSEMGEALAKFQQLGGAKEKTVPAPGLFEYLSLPPDVQTQRDQAALRQAIEQRPSDLDLKITLAELLFRQNRTAEALALVTENFKPAFVDGKLLARLTNVLLASEQYSTALPLLEPVLKAPAATEELALAYVEAKFHTSGAAAALAALPEVPAARRSGNYYLLQAQLFDELGRFPEAVAALNLALRSATTRPDLYFQACSFLIKHQRFQECLQLLDQADRHVPGSSDLALVRAVVLQMMNQTTSAVQQLSKIEAQWPEWPFPYIIHGIILQGEHQAAEAKQLLESAIALGTSVPAAYFQLALAMKDLAPNDNENAYKVISRGIELAPDDPYMQVQAGRIALDMKDYSSALTHLKEAIRLFPDMANAHWLLANLYRVTGQTDKLGAEIAEVERLNKLFPPGTQTPPSMQNLLFSLRRSDAAGPQR